MRRSRGDLPGVVIVAALDLHGVGAVLALMLGREKLRLHVRLGMGAPPATTTREPPSVRRAARPAQTPAPHEDHGRT